MGVTHINHIKPGMVLDDDIRDHHGRFLLGKDLTIESKHLRILKIWGINQADIKNDDLEDSEGDEKFDVETLNLAQEIVHDKISWSNKTSKINKNLLEIFVNSTCQKLSNGQKNFGFTTDQQTSEDTKEKDLINPELRLDSDTELISVPRIFFLIREAIKDPRTSARHIADIISKDQALAAKLLRLVNSAFYGFPSKIDTISRAVTIIGTRQLSSLALGLSTLSRFRNISPEVMDMESFWKHSIACAIGAKTLAGYRKLPNTESFFICGLLHDLGKLIMLNYYPREYLNSLLWARKNKSSLSRAEKIFFVLDHASLGAKLAKKWKLPLKIEQTILHHERPLNSSFPLESTMVHTANILANGCFIGSGGESTIPEMDVDSWKKVHLETNTLNQTARLMQSQVDNIYQLLFHQD